MLWILWIQRTKLSITVGSNCTSTSYHYEHKRKICLTGAWFAMYGDEISITHHPNTHHTKWSMEMLLIQKIVGLSMPRKHRNMLLAHNAVHFYVPSLQRLEQHTHVPIQHTKLNQDNFGNLFSIPFLASIMPLFIRNSSMLVGSFLCNEIVYILYICCRHMCIQRSKVTKQYTLYVCA